MKRCLSTLCLLSMLGWLRKVIVLPVVPISKCHLPGNFLRLKSSSKFRGKWYPILDQNSLISIPYPEVNSLKTTPFTAAHTYISIPIWEYPPPPGGGGGAGGRSVWNPTLLMAVGGSQLFLTNKTPRGIMNISVTICDYDEEKTNKDTRSKTWRGLPSGHSA